MRVVGIPDHFIISSIRYYPLVLPVLYLESVHELLLEVVGVLANEVLRAFTECTHTLSVVGAALMLCKGIFVLTLLLTHFAVVFVLS